MSRESNGLAVSEQRESNGLALSEQLEEFQSPSTGKCFCNARELLVQLVL